MTGAIYPDNVNRAARLQQLINSIAHMQTDIKTNAAKLGDRQSELRTLTDELLTQAGIDSVDVLVKKSTAQLTSRQKSEYKKLIESAKQLGKKDDVTTILGGMLFVGEGAMLNPRLSMAAARMVLRVKFIEGLAGFFLAGEQGAVTAAQSAKVLEGAAEVAGKVEAVEEPVAEGAEVAAEVGEAVGMATKVAKVMKLLGAVGFVVALAFAIYEAVKGAEQKEKLTEGIHNMQPARLIVRFFKEESLSIVGELELLTAYLEAHKIAGDATAKKQDRDDNKKTADVLRKKIIDKITAVNNRIDLGALEDELEEADRTSASFYGDDDLERDEVINLANQRKVGADV